MATHELGAIVVELGMKDGSNIELGGRRTKIGRRFLPLFLVAGLPCVVDHWLT